MRLPDPIANTTTEAYLAYKAGVLEESELKPKLYYPTDHFDAWLAYWAGLTGDYPNSGIGKNIMPLKNISSSGITSEYDFETGVLHSAGTATANYPRLVVKTPFKIDNGTTYTMSVQETHPYTIHLRLWYDNTNYLSASISPGATSTTKTTTKDCTHIEVLYQTGSNTSIDEDFELQFEIGSSATTFEPYSGKPECYCDEEALVAYLTGVANTYPDSVKDPYDVRIAGYLRYLISARFGRPEYPVNNSELYLSMLKPPVVTNATPSTDIELNGTVEAEFVDIKLYGQTSQDTYTGEQLLMKQGYATPTSDTDFWASFATYKVSKRDLSDDWAEITVGGTEGSGFGDMNIKPGNVLNFTANTTYTIILEFKDKSGAGTSGDAMINFNIMQPGSTNDAWVRESINIVQGAVDRTSNIVVTLADSNWTSRTAVVVATTKEDISGKYALRTFTRPQVPVGTKFKIRATVLVGDHSSDWQNYAGDNYQPYLNGEFSPNPYAPQQVNMVTGSQDIAIHGKNLFRNKSITAGGIKFEYNEDTGEMTVSGTPSIYYAVATRIYPQKPLPAGTYTISIQDTLPFSAGVGTYNPSGTRSARPVSAGNKKYTFTVSTTINSFDFYLTNLTAGQDIGTHTIKFQLEEGSEATSFEPYIGGDHIVSLGQNLLSIPDGTYSNSGVSAVVDGETITVNRTSTNNNTSFIRIPLDKPIHLAQGEKLWIEANNPHYIGNSTDDYMAIRLRAGTDVGSTDLTLIETDNKREFVADKDYDFDYFVIRTDSKLSPDNFVIRPEYFIDPVELGMIETYEDYIYQDGREWFIKKYVKKVVLDGTDDDNLYWTRENTSGDWIKFNADCLDMMYHQHPVVCSHFKYLNQDNANSGIEHIYTFYGYHGFCVWVKQSLVSTMEGWRAWLAANKPVLYYELQEPVDIQITDPRLIAQLDELKKSGSYDKTTYITVSASGDDLPALLKIEAGA